MKKIKKIMAMLLAMVMVLGMTVTASAAEKVTITVNGEDGEPINVNAEDSKFEYVQVIKPERTARTGWTFTDDRYAQAYMMHLTLRVVIRLKMLRGPLIS